MQFNMSHAVSRNVITILNAPTTPNGKSSVVEPKLSDGERLELTEMLLSEPEANLNEDIMQLARLGDIRGIERLYQSGNFNSSYCDREGITPLHWAAINNQYLMCEFLINEGADVNKKGGESAATPAMWAAQRCHYYVVNLLLKNGADLFATEVQGYNILHLATFEGSMFLLVLLLHQGIDVDTPDLQGHTCLMWAAYKGFPTCVDLFLRWGANIHITDETGFTALHWALVKGSQGCIQKLLEYGADRFAKTLTGKTPAVTAHEMKTERIWQKALLECGYDENGNPLNIKFPASGVLLKNKRAFMNKFFFLFPILIIWIMITIVSHMVIFVGIPLALFAGYTLQWLAQQVAVYAPSDMKKMQMTPWLAGIFTGTLFLVGLNWLTTLLPETYSSHPISNILFGTFYALCTYFYACTMIYEPGFVPKLGGISQQKAVVDELLSEWKFDEYNFCIPCMIRQPLRSKHCRKCGRCVAKHDHHCPWVYNCIGINNHRHFLMYLITLELGVIMLIKITIGYFEQKLSNDSNATCNLLASYLCKVVNTDSYTLILVFWAMLQLTWVSMLIFVQLIQISRATTTWENMRGTNYDRPSKASEAIMSALTTSTAASASLGRETNLSPRNHHHHHHKRSCFDTWKRILGVDTFVETALSRKERRRNRNPFSAGFLVNCRDFWCDSAPFFGRREDKYALLWGQAVDYTSMYEIPDMTVKRQHERDVTTYQSVPFDDDNE